MDTSTAKRNPGQAQRVKSGGLSVLKAMEREHLQKKYPGEDISWLPLTRFTDKTANGLTTCIIKFLQWSGQQAERISVTGRQIDQRTTFTDVLGHTRQVGGFKWIRSAMQPGTADISATIRGRSVKVEVKVGRDRQRAEQARYQQQVEAAGGIYFIASTFQQFHDWYVTTFE